MHIGHEHMGGGQPASADDTAICPVMNIEVSKRAAAEHGLIRVQDGKKYYLCCDECAASFTSMKKPEGNGGTQ